MRRAGALVADVGGVLAALVALFALETLAVGVQYRAELVGLWELREALAYVCPVALVASVPLAVLAVSVGRLVAQRRAAEVAAVAAFAGTLLALGVSTGRHLASWALRAPFVLVVALLAAGAARVAARRAPLERTTALAAAGAGLAALAWVADGHVLPRLYPAFHLALLVVTACGWSATWLLFRTRPAARALSLAGLVATVAAAAWAPHAARSVAGSDNLRRILLERAPLLGRAVLVASRVAPPPPLDDDGAEVAVTGTSGPRSLDWAGRDIVLVTIDALRADHVSSYGYPRATTPSIDRLAARGVRFTHAYCPTPHTSYSIASMMTGKYVRPLLALGASDDDETWALHLRRYGYRTAAFYPPAVFFIDEHKFPTMKSQSLGFEYKKEEFAGPSLRRAQLERYLELAPRDKPLFVWVHAFEPHEPYEMHAEHPFSGDDRSDAYDSEIAAADALVGDIERLVERRRPGAVIMVSADHGEELGDHGGRYHGTTVYEEQVRVPLVVVAPGLPAGVVDVPVQTIDLLPTTLAALDIPRPARLRGRDLGPLLSGRGPGGDEGLAFAETDDYTLVARGRDRLVCARKIGACSLYDVVADPAQKAPVTSRPARASELRKLTAAIERENGKVEAASLPEALRRGLQGDREAAEDVAPLLDDARVDIRRAAARCAFKLRAPAMAPQLRRALASDEDPEVREWSALALTRLAEDDDAGAGRAPDGAATLAAAALGGADAERRTAAALALAERGDPRGEPELFRWWEGGFFPGAHTPGELDEARELLDALVRIGARSAVPLLVSSLSDVRLRPYVVDAVGALGDVRARDPLLALFAEERYVNVRAKEARALATLGAKGDAFRSALARFAGVPEPTPEVLAVAREAGLLSPDAGGVAYAAPRRTATAAVRVPGAAGTRARLLVLVRGEGPLTALVDGVPVTTASATPEVRIADVSVGRAPVGLALEHDGGVLAAWIVRRAEELPPPPPRAWDAGAAEAASDEIP